ncbi:MAG TPA: alpha/beta hydrolase [Burkholderiales bacterium]|nr:alpha/beta hydrolase [Burkholderiales bacterium]
MPQATINGLKINYAVQGNGPPMIMLSPGGFDSNIDGWSSRSAWKELRPLETLAKEFTMIAYDRREAGQSGGRVEPHTWYIWAAEAVALLDHLKIDQAWVIGGCMGVSVASAIGAHFPERCLGLLMHWPVGGFRWRAKGHLNFNKHIAFARANGLAAVAARAKKAAGFWADPESGPWATVLAQDEAFAVKYVKQGLEQYLAVVAYSRDTVFDDTMPSGATGEQLMAIKLPSFIMSGDDASHATSAAHALRELIPGSVLSPLMPPQQNAATVTAWIRESVASVKAA